ncbi:MAG: hypothetical protein R3C56_10665 [Pirellulaceae bacterium]
MSHEVSKPLKELSNKRRDMCSRRWFDIKVTSIWPKMPCKNVRGSGCGSMAGRWYSENPVSWLVSAGRFKAIDRIRRDANSVDGRRRIAALDAIREQNETRSTAVMKTIGCD